ncbi:MAG: nitrite/sulfite reductase, partial [Bacteroides sp.]|nr:nitrite/sulfite reductase [Bacteroides sp.]
YIDSLIREYKAGKVEEARFKAIRVPMGIYEQRTNGTYMVRVRCSGGYIAPMQLKAVAEVALRDEIPYLHVTTRQEIQLHYADLGKVKEIFTSLQRVELGTKGGGGNTIRNIMADEQAGIDSREVFDIYPYYSDLTTFLIAQNDSFTLPRKLKIAFSISEELPGYAVVNDLGFIPRIVDGERGFRVYLGGSVASRPTLGWLIHNFVPEKDFLRVAIAVKRFFSENGNRKNRHKARIRHIFYKLGAEETIRLYQTYFEAAKSEPELDYVPGTYRVTNTTPAGVPVAAGDEKAFRLWKLRYATAQKQAGYYAVILPLQHGNLTPDVLLKIAGFAEGFGNDVIRFTPASIFSSGTFPKPG